MSNTFTLSVDVEANSPDAGLAIDIFINDRLVKSINPVSSLNSVSVDVDDSNDAEHELKFVLKNKLPEHTVIDESGNIVKDAVVEIKNLKFDDIDLGYIFYKQSVYQHNFNGGGPDTEEQFFGTMGCNGTVILKFRTPMYLWMLEHM